MTQPELGVEQRQLIGIPIRRRELDTAPINSRSPIDNTIKIRQHKVGPTGILISRSSGIRPTVMTSRDPKAAGERPKPSDRPVDTQQRVEGTPAEAE